MTINVGIAGLGKMGGVYLSEIGKRQDMKVVAVYDPKQIRPEIVTDARRLSDLGEFVRADFDLGIVTSLTGTHHEVAIPLFDYGKYVLTEKPIDKTVEQADEIISAAARNRKPLMIAFGEYFNPVTGIVTENLPKIGSILRIDIKRNRPELEPWRQVGDSALPDCLVHDIYNFLAWLPDPVQELAAVEEKRANRHMPYNDYGFGYMRSGDAVINFEASWSSPAFERVTTIYGTNGSISVDYKNGFVEIRKEGKIEPERIKVGTSNVQPILDAAIETMTTGKQFPVSVSKSREAVNICNKLIESASQGGRLVRV